MPIFNKDLPEMDKPSEGFPEHEELYKGKLLPDTLHPAVPSLGDEFGAGDKISTNMDVQDVFRMNSFKPGPIFGSTVTELEKNKRYDFYKPGVNYEDIYSRTQPWYDQIGNGLVKMGAFALGTFAQSFNSIPQTIAAAQKGDLSELSGKDGYVAPIDDWMQSFEDAYPNFESDYERAHPFKSILGSGFSNFLGNKFLKNLGFMGGSIAGALVQDAAIGALTEGIGEIPLLANQIGKASLWLNKVFSSEMAVGRALGATEKGILTSFLERGAKAGRTTEQLARMESLAQLAASSKLNNQFRYGLNLWTSSLTEMGVESRDGYRTLKNDLIEQYKLENFGQGPSGKDLQDIEDISVSAMNARAVGNLAILLLSNAIQFENILKPFSSARTGLTSPVYQEIAGKRLALQDGLMGGYSEVVPKSVLGKVSRTIKPYVPEVLVEGVYEEGGQFALEKGTYAYYNKKYLDQKNNRSRNDVAEFMSALGQGLTDQFGTTAGWENMFIGALTAGVVGKGRAIMDNVRGVGTKAQVAAEINNLNSHQLMGVFQNNFENAAQQLQASKDMEAAVKNKDVFAYKNAQYKAIFGYVNSRLQGNRFGLLEEELKLAKELPDDQFKQMFGFDANADNRRVASEYINLVQEEANKIKENHNKINEFFVNPYKYIRTPKNDEEVKEQSNYRMYEDYKTAMTYFPSLLDHLDKRESSIQEDLTKINPLLSVDLVKKLGSTESILKLAEEYEKEAKENLELITEYTSPEDRKNYERKAKDLRNFAEEIYKLSTDSYSQKDVTSSYLKLFNNLVNFELNVRDGSSKNAYIKHPLDVEKAASFAIDLSKIDDARKDAGDAFDILSDPEKGFEEFRKVDESRLPPKHAEGSEISQGREYEIDKVGKYRVKKIADDRYQIIGPDKTIISTHSTKLEASSTARYLNSNLKNLKKITAVRDNGDGTVRVIDQNGDVQDIPKAQLLKYTPLETQLEKLAKDKEILKKEQEDIENSNGGVSTGDPSGESVNDEEEGALRDSKIHFISGTTESEKYEDVTKSSPHVKRSREFLNNVKNFKNRNKMRAILVSPNQMEALGLKGLVQMSFKKDLTTPLSEIPDVNDPEKGFIAQVFVVQEGNKVYFVGKDGEKLTEVGGKDADGNVVNVDLNEVIFQTMPVPKDKDSKGKDVYRSNQKEEFEAYKESWKKYKKQLFKLAENTPNKYPIFEFTVSRGFPKRNVINGQRERNHVGYILVEEDKIANTRGLVVIPTTGTVAHNGQLLKFPNGRPVLQDGDTLQFLNNKKFSDKQARAIFEVIKALSEGYISKRVLERKYTTFLKNVLFYSKKEGVNNRFYINPDTSDVIVGTKKFSITEVANSEKEIIEELKNTFNNVNNDSLTKKFDDKFVEFYINDEGNLAERAWKNYQSYLLSAKYSDGKARSIDETPLSTDIAAPTSSVPYSFEQKYATLQGLTLDVQFTPKAAPKPAAPASQQSIAGISFDGKTENKLKMNDELGEVGFIAATDQDGKVNITIVTNDKIKSVANSSAVEKYRAVLQKLQKELYEYDPAESAEQHITDFLTLSIGAQVINKLEEYYLSSVENKQISKADALSALKKIDREGSEVYNKIEAMKEASAQTAATFTPTTPYGTPTGPEVTTATGAAPTSTDAKADIERRRQEELNKFSGGIRLLKITPDGNIELTERQIGSVEKAIKQGIDQNKSPEEIVAILNGLGFAPKFGEETRSLINYIKDRKNGIGPEYQDVHGQMIDKINAKYDAELAALEAKPKEGGETDGPSDNFNDLRAVASGETGMMTDEEIEIFKKWHAEVVPLFPYEVLENMVTTHKGEKAWGVYENGIAKFVRGGLRGTEYHEIGHGIWKVLPLEEREAIVSELRESGKDFTDRATGKKLNYATATEKQIEERIWDDFSDYRIGKLPARTLTEKIRRLFKMIMDFFKSFVSKPTLKEQLFKAIDAGRFKETAVPERVKNEAADYRRMGEMSEKETHEWIQDAQSRISRMVYARAKEALFSPAGVTSKELFNALEEQYKNEKYKGVIKRDYLGDNWETLIKRTKESLRTLGISFNDDERVDINDVDYNNRMYAPEPFSVDWKRNSPGPIRFTVATLIQMKALNQEGKLEIETPKPSISDIGGYKLVNSTRAFATLMDKLCNTSSVSKAVEKILNLAKYDSTYVEFYKKIGGKTSTQTVDLDQFSHADWRLFIQMMQTFTKQKPEALIQYVRGNETYVAPANIYTAIDSLKREWMNNMKLISKKPYQAVPYGLTDDQMLKFVMDNDYRIIRFDGDSKTYKVDTKALKLFPIKNPVDQVKMLNRIGIVFPIEVYNSLKTNEKNEFARAVSSIISYFGKEEDVMKITKETIGINGPLSTLAELVVKTTNPNIESTYFNVEGERVNSYADNNFPSVFENEFNESGTLDELLEKRPELKDVFSTSSQVLKKGGKYWDEDGVKRDGVQIKIKYIQGIDDDGKGKPTSRLGLGERYTQGINQNVNGNYYILIGADGSTEWMINFGNTISFEDVDADRAWPEIYDIFGGYLMDDINLALDASKRRKLKNVGDRASELRFFKDILSEEVLSGINDLISEKATLSQIEEYIKNNIEDINASIKSYIETSAAKTRKALIDNMQVIQYNENMFSFPEFDSNFSNKNGIDKNNLSDDDVNKLMVFLNANYIINNIEMHKVLFGDPYQFEQKVKNGKIILDETKRIKSFLSPARTSFDHPVYNNKLNTDANLVGEYKLQAGDKEKGIQRDPGYTEFKPYMNSVTFVDDKIVGSLANIMSAYGDVNVADAASWLMDFAYREVKLKNGQWDMTGDQEKWHQYQMAYTRKRLSDKGKFSYEGKEDLRKADEKLLSKPSPKHTIEVLKPIIRGVKYDSSDIDLDLGKTSQMPIYYSMVEGTALEDIYLQMMENDISFAIVQSGRKVGIEEMHSIYNSDGKINTTPFNNNIKVSWKSYGLQVETSFEKPKEQTRGSQITKLSSLDLFENGEPTSEEAKKEYERNTRLLNEMTLNAYRELLNKLGVIDTGNGFVMPNGKAVSETLMYEMLRREMSDNAKDTIQTDENYQFLIPFEASPSYVQIRNIMYSMIDKALVSPKVSGGSYVQVPVTGFERQINGRDLVRKVDGIWQKISRSEYEKLSEQEKKNVALTDNTLKFYEDKDGKRYCEVMIPAWFKKGLNKNKFPNDQAILDYLNDKNHPERRKILEGIGFRIPTQATSSIDVFVVKGFLPQYMGYTVVVPAEITTKAGSDFDIDKLNMYLKSIYTDVNGDIHLVEYKESEAATKEFYGKLFDQKLEKKKANKAELLEAARIMMYELDDPKNLVGKYSDFIDDILSDVENYNDFDVYLEREIEKLNDVEFQSVMKEKFVKNMYKRSLENEYYDSLQKMISLPENFRRLISPVGDAGLPKVAERLDELIGYDESTIKNRILDRNYMTELRHAFLIAKRWVGIAAVNITGHSVFQKSKVYIDKNKLDTLSAQDRKFIGDASIALDHNTVEINGETYVSMSGRKTKDGSEFISDRLSGYATSFVDVAKDPYILKIIKSDLVVGTFMFLERIGAGKQAAMFLNQPIIAEYLKMLDAAGAKGLFTKSNINYIKSKFITTSDLLESAQMDVSVSSLEKNIEDYYTNDKTLSKERNAEQILIFNEFLKYAKMAEHNFKLSQAINYDTTKFRSGDAFSRKQWRTELARQSNIISSVDDILENSFLGDLEKSLNLAMSSMQAVFKLETPEMRSLVEDVTRTFGENDYVGNADFEKIALKAKLSLLDYIILTKTSLGSRLKELLVDSGTSVAERLMVMKEKYPELQILKDLTIDASDRPDGAKSIKLVGNVKDAYDENLYTGYMRELRDHNEETYRFYKDLVLLSLSQGSYQSPITFRNIVPIEDYSEILIPAMNSLKSDESMKEFKNSFYKNNFKDDAIMPSLNPKFFLTSEDPVEIQFDSFGNEYADIYQYYSSLFPTIDTLKVKSSQRKILLLNRKYNDFYMKNSHLKVPRVVIDRQTGDGIDMLTGKTVTKLDYVKMKAKGDLSLTDFFGYQRVDVSPGNPLVTYDKEGNEIYVYKIINLQGDGYRSVEHYTDDKESVFQNGTIRVSSVIPDADIIEYYGGKISKKDIPSQEKTQQLRTYIPMSDENVAKLESGEKTMTLRTQSEADLINIPVNNYFYRRVIGGKDYAVKNRGFLNVMEAGGKDAVLKAEGVTDESELQYEYARDFVNGKIRLYVYEIAPAPPRKATPEKSRLEILKEKIKTKGLSPAEAKELADLEKAPQETPKEVSSVTVIEQPTPKEEETPAEKSLQDIINKSNLEPGEYEIAEINGEKRVINKLYVPERVKKGFSKFYSLGTYGSIFERYGKKAIIPGFEDIDLMMEQDTNNVFELSTGLNIPTNATTQKDIKEELERIFKQKNIRDVLAKAKKIDLNYPIEQAITFESAFSPERQKEILTNFSKKHNLSEEESLAKIKEAVISKGQEVINKLKECY